MENGRILDMQGVIEGLIDIADKAEESLETKFSELVKGQISAYRNALQSMVLVDMNTELTLNEIILGLSAEVDKRKALYKTDWKNLHPDFVLGEMLGYGNVVQTLIHFREENIKRREQLREQLNKESSEWVKFLELRGLRK